MSGLVIDLGRVRNAVDQSARLGMPEPREAVVRRMVADAIERHVHGGKLADLYTERLRRQVSAYSAPGGAS
ncbi:hypothetical protein [uncultured Luteimonas sp.]|uniref:hypothetical protein n=1 Tax=uncultured Luteimonas sp. TaxID=453144 RepID=UPI0026266188|nr:hypothetical protein [uncultured Luteimonas sp.]